MSKTLTNLREAVRVELRDPDGIRFRDPDVDHAVNQAYRHIYFIVLEAQQGYFEKTPVFHSTTAGSDVVALPSDHYHTVRLEYVYSNNTTIPLKRHNRGVDTKQTANTTLIRTAGPFTYDFQGNNLVLDPVPSVSETNCLKHTYIQALLSTDDLVNPADPVHADFKDSWCDALVLKAAIACASQVENLGAYVDKNLTSRYTEALTTLRKSLGIRSYSPNSNRRMKGYFK